MLHQVLTVLHSVVCLLANDLENVLRQMLCYILYYYNTQYTTTLHNIQYMLYYYIKYYYTTFHTIILYYKTHFVYTTCNTILR